MATPQPGHHITVVICSEMPRGGALVLNGPAIRRCALGTAAALERRSSRLRKSQVHFAGTGIGPSTGHDLGLGVKSHAFRPVHVQVAEERGLPSAEAVVGHWNRYWHVDAHHAHLDIELTLSAGAPLARDT